MTGRRELTDKQWAVVEPVLPPPHRQDSRGLRGIKSVPEQILDGALLDELPARLIGDKVYDSDWSTRSSPTTMKSN